MCARASQPDDRDESAGHAERGSVWILPLLCVGVSLLACTLVIPAADANRRLRYERAVLNEDLAYLDRQIERNETFLDHMGTDPVLRERIARRQLRLKRPNEKLIGADDTRPTASPFELTQVEPARALAPYEPFGGKFADLCRSPQHRLYLAGTALAAIAVGLLMGAHRPRG